jgi:hypothetical protein
MTARSTSILDIKAPVSLGGWNDPVDSGVKGRRALADKSSYVRVISI